MPIPNTYRIRYCDYHEYQGKGIEFVTTHRTISFKGSKCGTMHTMCEVSPNTNTHPNPDGLCLSLCQVPKYRFRLSLADRSEFQYKFGNSNQFYIGVEESHIKEPN